MNASFRTAFWAMCLGLTVPMVLFVAVELTSGSKARRATTLAAADRGISLRTQLSKSAGNASGAAQIAASEPVKGEMAPAPKGDKSAASGSNSDGKVVLDPLEVDPADSQVVLGPGLEPVPAAPIAAYDRRVPASAVVETRPKVTINPEIETVPQASAQSTAAIEARLTGIQHDLDKLGRAIDAQAKREPAGDPIKQATELLKQLQEAHLINSPANSRDDLVAGKSNGDEPSAQRTEVERDSPSPVTETSSDPAVPETGIRADETRPKPVTRIYRPRYLSGSALHALVMPLLTPNQGRAGAADMASDDAATSTGGSTSVAPTNALVVSDLPDVIRKIDLLFQKLDAPPVNVVIEAVVLSVQLNNGLPNGINLLDFNGPSQPFTMTTIDGDFVAAGSGQSGDTLATSDPLKLTRKYGLKRGILNGDPQAFLGSLQAAVPTLRTDAWQMTVVNRQPANLMLTDPFGTGGSSDQSAAGTILRIRPIVARHGIVHLDVRRDVVLDLMAVAGTRAAALTNQFSLHDGQTAVIGGFFADQSVIQLYRPSGIGQIPLFGGLFCKQIEAIERTETIVLLTPHVVSTDAEQQVSRAARPSTGTVLTSKVPKIIPASGGGPRQTAPMMRPKSR